MMRYEVKLIKEPQIKKFDNTKLTLTFGNIKSYNTVIVTPKISLFNYQKELFAEYEAKPIVTSKHYRKEYRGFDISTDDLNQCVFYELSIILDNVTTQSSLRFNRVMFNEGDVQDYHEPLELIKEVPVKFNNNFYSVLYTNDDSSLQVIRPNYDQFTTKKLSASKCTVLAPHLSSDLLEDTHQNIGLEYMNMSDQVISILR